MTGLYVTTCGTLYGRYMFLNTSQEIVYVVDKQNLSAYTLSEERTRHDIDTQYTWEAFTVQYLRRVGQTY